MYLFSMYCKFLDWPNWKRELLTSLKIMLNISCQIIQLAFQECILCKKLMRSLENDIGDFNFEILAAMMWQISRIFFAWCQTLIQKPVKYIRFFFSEIVNGFILNILTEFWVRLLIFMVIDFKDFWETIYKFQYSVATRVLACESMKSLYFCKAVIRKL